MTALMEAFTAASVLAEQRAETIREQAERLGYVTAERDTARAELERLRQPVTIEQPPAPQPEPAALDRDIPTLAPFPAPIEPTQNAAPWWWSRWLVVLWVALMLAVLAPIGLLVVWQ
jgi:hypothetical protein